jgi:hypothetical protein
MEDTGLTISLEFIFVSTQTKDYHVLKDNRDTGLMATVPAGIISVHYPFTFPYFFWSGCKCLRVFLLLSFIFRCLAIPSPSAVKCNTVPATPRFKPVQGCSKYECLERQDKMNTVTQFWSCTRFCFLCSHCIKREMISSFACTTQSVLLPCVPGTKISAVVRKYQTTGKQRCHSSVVSNCISEVTGQRTALLLMMHSERSKRRHTRRSSISHLDVSPTRITSIRTLSLSYSR